MFFVKFYAVIKYYSNTDFFGRSFYHLNRLLKITHTAIDIVQELWERYVEHDIAQQGAALAYYLLFSLFPLLILIHSIIGQLNLNLSSILDTLSPILPDDIVQLVAAYLRYVAEHSSRTLLYFSLIFSIYFPMRATNCLMRSVRRAYHLPTAKNRIRATFKVLFYTVLFLVSIALTLMLMTVGRKATRTLGTIVLLPEGFPELWNTIRFLAVGLILFAALGTLYAIAQDRRRRARAILPGAILSTFSWMLLSALYAFYVEHLSNYSIIYGALGTVIVLLIWLYLTALTLILGAEFNDTLLHRNHI